MFGIMDNLGDDAGKALAISIGTFIMTAVMIGMPILAVLSVVFNWPVIIKIITTLVNMVIFVFLWSVIVDCCSD